MTRPQPKSEIRGINSGPAGRPRTSVPTDWPWSGAHPFTADATALLRVSADCRMASAAYAAEANKLDLRGPEFAEVAADVARMAFQLQQAAQALGDLSQDGEALYILAHRAAGGTVTCSAPLVVVGLEQHHAAPPARHAGALQRLAHRLVKFWAA